VKAILLSQTAAFLSIAELPISKFNAQYLLLALHKETR